MSEVISVRYGTGESTRRLNFYKYQTYGQPDAPIRLDFFFWVIVDGDRLTLVDTGAAPGSAEKRTNRTCLVHPVEALARLGISPAMVSDVVVTHFHWDHIGNVTSFPNSRLWVQRRELDFWLGPYAHRTAVAAAVEHSEIAAVRTAVADGRATVLDGPGEVYPGLNLELVGGHCPGQQIAILDRGTQPPVVLASDALHHYEELDRNMPFSGLFDVTAMYCIYDKLAALQQERDAIIVPGHDPAIAELFPSVVPGDPQLAYQIC